MQLISKSDTDIYNQRKMSAIEQESFNEKFINSSLLEKIDSETCDINKDYVKERIVEFLDENEYGEPNGISNISKDDKNILLNSNETSNDIISIDQTENNKESNLPIVCDPENSNEASEIVTEEKESEKIKSNTSVEMEHNEEKQTDLQSREDEKLNEEQQAHRETQENIDNQKNAEQENEEKHEHAEPESKGKHEYDETQEVKEKLESEQNKEILTNTDLQENICGLDTSMQKSNNDKAKTITITDTESDNSKEISTHNSIGNENIIDIQDEKEDESVPINDQELTNVDKQLEILSKNESDNIIENKESLEKDDNSCEKTISTPKESSSCCNKDIAKNAEEKCLENEQSKKEPVENKLTNNKESKNLSHICKLSNTLDILSDEDEEPAQEESLKEISSVEKQCINIDDDDDIMLVDEETDTKDNQNAAETKVEDKECQDSPSNSTNIDIIQEKETVDANKDSLNITEKEPDTPQEENKSVENKLTQKPLLPVNFLKSCKKNLADMTRDELEEFCILKIVESVVDRSNLSEIKAQLKNMGQNIEEYKKKAMTISKQNRDLQVVLKSVQEEQKKKSDVPITPLKITRSVGMQVFMTDKITVRRKSTLIGNNSQNNLVPNNSPNRLNKSLSNQSPKTQSNGNNNQQIPVPRLVPANNTNNNKVQAPSMNTAAKAPATVNLPNGIRTSPPAQKPEKRTHNKMQQGNSVTVDLTDDEPPSKIVQRNVNPPVRLVSPQNLLAPQRQPFGSNVSSPRKVYIPISGSQNQVRAGQTIMLKTVTPPQGPRPRFPPILPKANSNTNVIRGTRVNNRHPAPLPDCIKQYQPPNWKELPPAPELKLSKVENGIVISWKIDGYQEERHEEIASYQLYAYQESSSPSSTTLWKKIGDVKALPLPMACTLTQFMAGYKYYFAVRAVDIRSRLGPFSAPGSILLLNKM
ncbi:myb-like protein X [Melitaea cinxia]|uniref:myb-like protein X n=1 Tax=Melitaea cinxia TaxID=113334 RepID=UPI001E270358|nr:myb-like protein X [Melitaea cinxia]XP_045450724.1 myb-like protein X [Melitaea cinxia]